jgi:hypothetical protein
MSIRTLTTSLRALTEARANHFGSPHHKVAQVALNKTPGFIFKEGIL